MVLLKYFGERVLRIQRALPTATEPMISAFMVQHDVGLITIAIWAEQGAVIADGGVLRKVAPPVQSADMAISTLKGMSVFRLTIGAVFSFEHGHFPQCLTEGRWILSSLYPDIGLACLVRKGDGIARFMHVGQLYDDFSLGVANIEGFKPD